MSSKSLKGLTIKIGGDTTDLSKSLDSVEAKGRSLSGELGHINRLLKLDPTNTELLAQKQEVLANAISNTEKKLDTLRQAEKQVQEQFERGEATEAQVRGLRREIIETTSKLERYKKAAEETQNAEKALADGADQVSRKMDDQADKTRDAEKAAEGLDDAAGDLASGGLTALVAAATATVAAVAAMAESSREYRTEMSKLDTAYKSSGHSAATARDTYKSLQSVIGETDQSVEAAQQIALLAESEKDAAEWAGLAAGLIGRMGDALQPETFYESANETLKLNKATGAYVQLLEGCGRNVEEFDAGLAACTTEQEKQAYMLDVTQQLLGTAADQYRETNAEVIRANEATEKLNESTARIGSTVEPAITDLKELGATLLDEVDEPLENAANLIRNDVIPAIKNFSTGVKNNMPLIKGSIVGATSALVAYRVATVANTVAQKGFAGALKGTAIAQKALNLAQSATPMGLVAVGVTAVAAALVAYTAATKKAKKPVEVLTEEEKALAEAVREAAEAFQEQRKATEEAFGDVTAEMSHVQKLADELHSLADASGRVQEKDQARVDFILHELNEALGTEYERVGDLIQQYDTLKGSVDEAIKSKASSLLIEELNDDYVVALQNETKAYEAQTIAAKECLIQKDAVAKAKEVEAQKHKEYQEALNQLGPQAATGFEKSWDLAKADLEQAQEDLTDAETKYADAVATYSGYRETILQYEAAQEAILSGNYQQAVDLLLTWEERFSHYSDFQVDIAASLTEIEIAANGAKKEMEEIEAGLKAGTGEYTQEMLDDSKENYESLKRTYANTYAEFFGFGEDMGQGLVNGSASMWDAVYDAGAKMIDYFLAGGNDRAGRHSPARATIEFGEDLGEGAVIGTKNKAKDLKRAGEDQAAALISGYREQEVTAQRALVHVADQQAARQNAGQMTAATANGPMLERILSAIEHGQVLVLDSDAVVGGTIDKYDREMGSRLLMVKRGAR